MASILDRYGIKEVANVTFYSIDATSGRPRTPVLYIDTAKVTTVESTAETSYATGGQGNGRLLAWDFGKEITMSLEDAVFSPKSLSIMFGDGSSPENLLTSTKPTETQGMVYKTVVLNTKKVWEALYYNSSRSESATTAKVRVLNMINEALGNKASTKTAVADIGSDPNNKVLWNSNWGQVTFTGADSEINVATYALTLTPNATEGSQVIEYTATGGGHTAGDDYASKDTAYSEVDGKLFASFYLTPVSGSVIVVGPDTFPGTYYITADTYARSEADGSDDFFQIIIPKGKITSENTLTLEADGDPTVFNMNVEVLRATVNGINVMMELVQYAFGTSGAGTDTGVNLDSRLTVTSDTD